MRTCRCVAVGILLLVTALAWANGAPERMEPTEVADGFKRIEVGEFRFDWKTTSTEIEVVLAAPTTGWLAIGFEPSRVMRDANIVIGYVAGDDVAIEDHFGNRLTAHRPDVDLGGSSDVTILGGGEADGRTEITFSIPLDSGDDYDAVLTPGSDHTIIFSYGADGADVTNEKHVQRGGFITTL